MLYYNGILYALQAICGTSQVYRRAVCKYFVCKCTCMITIYRFQPDWTLRLFLIFTEE